MATEDGRQLTLTSITDWSKWLTGLSIFSAGGCITVLLTKGVGEKNIINIKLAIILFVIALFVSWIIQLVVAELKQHVAAETSDAHIVKDPITVFSTKILRPALRLLVIFELVIFLFAVFYLTRWIWNIPSTSPLRNTEQIVKV